MHLLDLQKVGTKGELVVSCPSGGHSWRRTGPLAQKVMDKDKAGQSPGGMLDRVTLKVAPHSSKRALCQID